MGIEQGCMSRLETFFVGFLHRIDSGLGARYVPRSPELQPPMFPGLPNYIPTMQPYAKILPGQPFVVKILCPPGACDNTNTNRMRILEVNANSYKMNWEAQQNCRRWEYAFDIQLTYEVRLVPLLEHLGFMTRASGAASFKSENFQCGFNGTAGMVDLLSNSSWATQPIGELAKAALKNSFELGGARPTSTEALPATQAFVQAAFQKKEDLWNNTMNQV